MKTLSKLFLKNPLVSSLFLFNTGIFAWLQTSSATLLNNLDLQKNLLPYIPPVILTFTGENVAAIEAFVGNRAWAWLIFSMIVLVIINFIKGLIKFIFVLTVIMIGIYLIYQNQEMLSSLVNG